ncbi:MAG: Gfo/Idh/MocA family oxidoreductase, partial [Propionibacteriaceae bacterium]|nr:Gfo/Idh/MocA family oxidoreductase [Propionibacteriaceae bacterium]
MTTSAPTTNYSDPMTAPAIRWGVLAPGYIARRFVREIPQFTTSTITAVGSRDLGRAERLIMESLEFCPGAKAYGSYEELVADPNVDAIYIASPHSHHHDHALLALRAGKPVLVEKAFTINAQQATVVFDQARSRNLFAMEAMWSRFLPHYDVMRQMVRADWLGELTSIVGVHSQALDLSPEKRLANPALAGGALLDLAIYPLSLLHWLWGVPDRVEAVGVLTATGVDLRESVTCWYGDHLGVAYADMGSAGKSSLQVVGAKGRIDIDDYFYIPNNLIFTPVDGEPEVIETFVEGGFQYQAAEAARCISAGKLESEIMSWQATVEVLDITDAARAQLS